jgi:O-antigen/teichoic acid export membrane protein
MGIGMSIMTVLNIIWVSVRFAPLQARLFDFSFIRQSVQWVIPFALAGLFVVMYTRTDQVMIEIMLGTRFAGQYGAAFRILEALNMLPAIVSLATVYPRLSVLHHENNMEAFRTLLRRSLIGLGLISLGVAVFLFVLSPGIISLLDPDPSFQPSGPALQILCWTFPFTCLNSLLYAALTTFNRQKHLASVLGFTCMLNIGMNLLLIPIFGINGASAATVMSEVLLLAAYIWLYVKSSRVPMLTPTR